MKWWLVRLDIDAETASESQLWRWVFIVPSLAAILIGGSVMVVAVLRGDWGVFVTWLILTIVMWLVVVYLRLRVVGPILLRRHPERGRNRG